MENRLLFTEEEIFNQADQMEKQFQDLNKKKQDLVISLFQKQVSDEMEAKTAETEKEINENLEINLQKIRKIEDEKISELTRLEQKIQEVLATFQQIQGDLRLKREVIDKQFDQSVQYLRDGSERAKQLIGNEILNRVQIQ